MAQSKRVEDECEALCPISPAPRAETVGRLATSERAGGAGRESTRRPLYLENHPDRSRGDGAHTGVLTRTFRIDVGEAMV